MNLVGKRIMTKATMLAVTLLVPLSAKAKPAFTKQESAKIAMSDGVHLAADVYVPSEGKTFPSVLIRTPYDKRGKEWLASMLASAGYVVVVQDVRGMNASEGRFVAFVNEKKDGLDTLDWITAQPWSNGKIGMWGTSYVAYCAIVLAPTGHPSLKTIVNMSGWGDGAQIAYPGGAMHLMLMLPWMLSNQIHGEGSFHDYEWHKAFYHVPVSEIPSSLGVHSPQWEGAMQAVRAGAKTDTSMAARQYAKIKMPIFHITGWNDFVARSTLDLYEHITRASEDDADAPLQKLLIGPWRHDQIWMRETKVGDEDFGPAARMGSKNVGKLCIRWYDRWLKGIDNGIDKEKPVKLFVMGDNAWREYDQWPPKQVEHQTWYLTSTKGANSTRGDGKLSTVKPKGDGSDRFVYDPMNPVPTTGGVNFHFFLNNLGPKDQRPVEKRSDVLVYTSDPLDKDTNIIGPVQAVVYASTEGTHTDFTAKLCEVRSDGYVRIIEDGIRHGPDPVDGTPVESMKPGKVYRFTIDLGATGIRIPKGHRLRVEVSSSNFPKYARNPNTGERPETAVYFRKVTQQVHHSPSHPSHVVIPVLK